MWAGVLMSLIGQKLPSRQDFKYDCWADSNNGYDTVTIWTDADGKVNLALIIDSKPKNP